MADLKISQLNEITSPSGTDVFPIVSEGVTKKVTLNTLRAGLSGAGSDVSGLSANWQNTYTTVQTNSGSWGTGGSTNFLPLSGGTVSGTQVIDANSPEAALRITQVGSGPALLVEDSVNPDVTPFLINQVGTLVVGASAASTLSSSTRRMAQFVSASLFNPRSIEIRNHIDTEVGPSLCLTKTRSGNSNDFTVSYPLSAEDYIGDIDFQGNASRFGLITVQNKYDTPANSTPTGSVMKFSTLSGGNFQDTNLVLDEGKVGIGTSSPNEALTVIGNISTTGTQVIDANSSEAALRITQVGTGPALLVEDSTNPDVDPFLVNAAGTLVIGASSSRFSITSPNARKIEIGNNSNTRGRIELRNHFDGSTGNIIEFYKYRNNDPNDFTTNVGMSANDNIATFGFWGQMGGSTLQRLGSILVNNKYDINSSNSTDAGSVIIFQNAVSGVGVQQNILTLDENKVGIGTTSPNEALTVVGNISATGTLQLSLTSAAPSNTTTPVAWTDIVVEGVTYKTPLYL